jgi:hypothetical protein
MFANLQAVRAVAAIVVFHLVVEAPLLRWMIALLRDRVPVEQQVSAEVAAAQE